MNARTGTEGLVAGWNSEIAVPCLFAATSAELQAGVWEIFDAHPDTDIRNGDIGYGTKDGKHGSSTLHKDLNPASSESYWDQVERYLLSIESDGKAFGG